MSGLPPIPLSTSRRLPFLPAFVLCCGHGELIGRNHMKLIAIYVVFVLIGETFAYGVGRTVEHWSSTASLPAFLAAFFFVFWAAWRLAIRVT